MTDTEKIYTEPEVMEFVLIARGIRGLRVSYVDPRMHILTTPSGQVFEVTVTERHD